MLAVLIVLAMVLGGVVWSAIAGATVIWLSLTTIMATARPSLRLPTLSDVVWFFLRSALGRWILIAAWAETGWHLFCQHP